MPDPLYEDLTPSANNAYAQVLDHAMSASICRNIANLTGTFARKRVSGQEYWYFQYRDIDTKVKQVYLGPRSERLDRLIEAKPSKAGDTLPAVKNQLAMQARAALALGNFGIPKQQFKIIRRLDEYGYFSAGGVLIGTHAFSCYGNMLGVKWGNFQKTQDLDFAYSGRNLSVALPSDAKLNLHDAIASLEMGFLPTVKLDGLAGGTYVVPNNPDFRLDFLTTIGRDQSDLVNFPNLNVAMVPLKFMEFILEDIVQAAVLSEDGAVLVNIPSPARYAMHKLIVAGEREISFRTKARKDLWQAGALIFYLLAHYPEALADAWVDIIGRGKVWRSRFNAGIDMLVRELPFLKDEVEQCRLLVSRRELERQAVDEGTDPQ